MAGRRTLFCDGVSVSSPHTSNPSGTLLRGLEVLEAFGPGRDFLGNADIAASTGLPKPTVSRLTRALVEAGYLEYDTVRGKYQLRPKVLMLGFSLLSNMKVLPTAHEQLQRFASESGCTVSLAWPDAPHMIYLDRCTGVAMPYFFSVGSTVDMASTATGRAYIASLGRHARDSLLKGLIPYHPQNWEALTKEIERSVSEVAEKGFCLVDTTWRRNIRAIASPIASRDGRIRMSISCVAQTSAMDRDTLAGTWGPKLTNLAEVLTRYL